jgi:transcriptional regulator of acetoin/glycerol metabolism
MAEAKVSAISSSPGFVAQVGPFVAINCAAIPEQLLESEFRAYSSMPTENAI